MYIHILKLKSMFLSMMLPQWLEAELESWKLRVLENNHVQLNE